MKQAYDVIKDAINEIESERKHTPGPWKNHYEVDYGFVIMAKDGKVADAVTRGGGESDANARLIAAAPDLLEACIEILSARTYCLERGGDILTSSSWARLEKAIAKAEPMTDQETADEAALRG